MAVSSHFTSLPSSSLLLSRRSPLYSRTDRICCACSSAASSLMDPLDGGRRRFMEFPYVSVPHRDLMVQLVSTVETRLNSFLLPCDLPPDVRYYQNQNGTAHASLYVRPGLKPSPNFEDILIDFILGSWVHCELPSGEALNITSLSAYLNSFTDAPNFMIELIQSSPTSLVLILDLPPRKDPVLHPEYLKTFYEDTRLDGHRQLLEKLPEVKPYYSSSLYIRCVVSPTAILVRIGTEAGQEDRVDQIVKDHVSPIAKEVLSIWLDLCACREREVGESERASLQKRDLMIKSKTIEIDLSSSFPRLFGQEVATRVLTVLREIFNA